MRCPSCQNEIPSGLTVCDICQAPLEARGRRPRRPPSRASSQQPLSQTGPPSPGGSPASAPKPQRSSARTGPQQSVRRSPVPGIPGGSVPLSSTGAPATRLVTVDPQVQRETRMVEVSVPAAVRRASRSQRRQQRDEEQADGPIDEAFEAARKIYRRLHAIDRGALWVLLLALVGVFLPWTYVRGEGLVSGVEGVGAAGVCAAVLGLACIYGRAVRRRWGGVLLFLQLICASAIVATPVYVWLVSVDVVKVAWGMGASALCGAIAVLLTLARLTRLNA